MPTPSVIDPLPGIYGFQDQYRFLSNFWKCTVVYDGLTYPSSEHAYQAAKLMDPIAKKIFTDPKMSAAKAKNAGRNIHKQQFNPDWDRVKFDVMFAIVLDKFKRNADLSKLLLDTGDAYLEETNTWKDTYWGVCNGVGHNNLGTILMEVRSLLRDGKDEIE